MKNCIIIYLIALVFFSCKKTEQQSIFGPTASIEFKGFANGKLSNWKYSYTNADPSLYGNAFTRPYFAKINGGFELKQFIQDQIPSNIKQNEAFYPVPDNTGASFNIYTGKDLDLGEYISYGSKTTGGSVILLSSFGYAARIPFTCVLSTDYTKIKITKKYTVKVTDINGNVVERTFYDGEFELQLTSGAGFGDSCKLVEGKFNGIMLR